MTMTAHRALVLLIVVSLALRLIFAATIGLGIDESYVVGTGRVLQWGYFDHPPAMWWLEWASSTLLHSQALLAVRLPFLLLFILTTFGMFRLTALVFDERAGIFAALGLNLAPVLGTTAASWVLPDGPMECALVFAALFLVKALQIGKLEPDGGTTGDWLAAGAFLGLALISKYLAVLTGVGALAALVLLPQGRRALTTPGPWLAMLVAFVIFLPVLAWNAETGWASLAFQSGRAAAVGFNLVKPLATLGAEAVYLLPWLWLALVVLMIAAFRAGPSAANAGPFLLACLALPPIALFVLIAFWSSQTILPHWAAPGYLFLLPLLGNWASRNARRLKPWIIGSIALDLALLTMLAVDLHAPFLPARLHPEKLESQLVTWTSLADQLAERGLLGPGGFVGAIDFITAGKLDYALAGKVPVLILSDDQRQYRFTAPHAAHRGESAVVIVAAGSTPAQNAGWAGHFSTVTPLPPLTVLVADKPVLTLDAYKADKFTP